jgi:hypothetical protein
MMCCRRRRQIREAAGSVAEPHDIHIFPLE